MRGCDYCDTPIEAADLDAATWETNFDAPGAAAPRYRSPTPATFYVILCPSCRELVSVADLLRIFSRMRKGEGVGPPGGRLPREAFIWLMRYGDDVPQSDIARLCNLDISRIGDILAKTDRWILRRGWRFSQSAAAPPWMLRLRDAGCFVEEPPKAHETRIRGAGAARR